MDKHYGEIIEMTIRRNGYSISELSRMLKVNRRSIYNWFAQARFKPEIIFKIGVAIRYDFSKEFPELFTSEDFQREIEKNKQNFSAAIQYVEETSYWKDKYITLLEEYNSVLAQQAQRLGRTPAMA
ncbi:helix-turn-helix domain-containing protein [Olivibacter sp. XZL3]|uniref:helix-turn-helix domain-containing protein n=1 Tax=Olivibacter sp. XZL3 TaxID=1735116 RepID=UPI001065A8C6|nr:helix-turn-helix domain-containing protein [Olivibacter sp. XZL3]